MTPIEALEKIIEVVHDPEQSFQLLIIEKIASEALPPYKGGEDDSSGKEMGSDQIFYVAVNEKDIPQNYDEEVFFYCPQIEKWLKPVNSQSVLYDAIRQWRKDHPYKEEESSGKKTRMPHEEKEKFSDWLVNNLHLTSKTNVELIINHVERYYYSQSSHPYKEEVDKEDELWDEVMQEMGFYSSQLDNIKSKFHLTRKI